MEGDFDELLYTKKTEALLKMHRQQPTNYDSFSLNMYMGSADKYMSAITEPREFVSDAISGKPVIDRGPSLPHAADFLTWCLERAEANGLPSAEMATDFVVAWGLGPILCDMVDDTWRAKQSMLPKGSPL